MSSDAFTDTIIPEEDVLTHRHGVLLLSYKNGGKKIAEFRNGSPPVFYGYMQKGLEKRGGIYLPLYLRGKYGNAAMIELDDARILDVFMKVVYPDIASDPDFPVQWRIL